MRPLLALALLVGIAWLLSEDRKSVDWRLVGWGMGLQVLFALVILRTPFGSWAFEGVNDALQALLRFSEAGSTFLFGDLVFNNVPVGIGDPSGNAPIQLSPGLAAHTGAYFAFHVLPTIIFVASLMTVLYHLGVMQRVVGAFAWVMSRTMKTSGAETMVAAGNIFVGLMEAPLLAKPFLDRMTRSELMAVMTAGLATVSGSVMAAFVGMLSGHFPDIGGHLVAASVMSAPAALALAKVMVPETEPTVTADVASIQVEREDVNVVEAAARGASEGLWLALNVAAMLIAFLALLALLNATIGWAGGFVGFPELTLEQLLGWGLAPVVWLVGIPWSEATVVGELVGIKTVLNEFVAFLRLETLLEGSQALSDRTVIITTYALAGFANFGSIAMTIAGIGGIAPNAKRHLAELGIRSMVAGAMAALMTASWAALLL